MKQYIKEHMQKKSYKFSIGLFVRYHLFEINQIAILQIWIMER